MKKNGFTLAEVLITLTIIGVVAAITLPALQTNTQEAQARTSVKKMVNTMTQAASMSSAIDGIDFDSLNVAQTATQVAAAPNRQASLRSLVRLMQDRCAVDTAKGYELATGQVAEGLSVDTAVYLRDGSAVYFNGAQATVNGNVGSLANNTITEDGSLSGIPVIFDINGSKGPNLLSNCSGTAAGIAAWNGDDTGTCNNRERRVIRDQFIFKLRNTTVVPVGAASNWILDESKTTAPAANERFAPPQPQPDEPGGDGGEGGNATP